MGSLAPNGGLLSKTAARSTPAVRSIPQSAARYWIAGAFACVAEPEGRRKMYIPATTTWTTTIDSPTDQGSASAMLNRNHGTRKIYLRSSEKIIELPGAGILEEMDMLPGRLIETRSTGRACCRYLAVSTVLTGLLSTTAAWTADRPTLLVLPLEMVDTSGEGRPKAHEDRLATLTVYLSQQLAAPGLYAVIDPAPIDTEIGKARAVQSLDRCNGCERDLARLVHADRVLIGAVYKVSTLIGSMRLSIEDVATGRSVFGRELGFRGDTDDAWQHAVRFFVRDLEETTAQQR